MGTRKSFKSLILSAWLLANQLVYCILRPTQMDTNLAAVFTGSFYTDNPRPQNHWLMRLTEKQNFRQDGPYQGTFSSKAMDTSDYRNSFGRQMDLHGFSHETNHVPSETLEQQATAVPSTPAKYVTKLPATNVTKNITVSTPSDFFLLVATRNLSTLRTSSSGSSNISIQDDILTKTTAFPDASAEIPREKYGLWHLNLTSCRFHSPSFKSFTRIRSFAHVDTLRAKYVLEANSNSSLRCNVVVYSVRKKYVSALTSVFTLEDRNGVCIGKHIYLSSFDGGGRRISGSLPCSSMFVSTSNTRGLLMIAVDINYYGSAVYSDLFLTLIIRFQLSSTYPEAVLSHVTEGPYTGQLTNFMFDGYILYSAWVSAAAIIRIHSQVLMISFTHFDIACSGYLHISTVKSGSTVTEYPLGLSLHPKVRLTDWSHVWSHCDQWNGGPRLYDRSLVVRFKSGGQAYTGFRMLYSIHNVTQAPQVMHSGLFNCSVPYYPAFRQHLECNLETQCFAREDEDGCPYNSQDCGTGFIDAGNKCLKFYRVRRAITWYDAYDHCSKQNMQLVSPKTQSESGVLLEILNFTVTSFKTPIGLRTSDMSLMPMYREVWQWVDQTMAFHNEMYASERLSKPVCSLLTAPDNYLLTTSCGRSSPFNFLFCERKKHDHRGQRSETRFTTTANFSRLTGSVEMIECPNGHHVKDFLSCDMLSQCGTDSYVTSCQTPELKDVSMFVCDVGAQTLHYTLVCDHRPDCSDGSDETFCVHGQCQETERQCRNKQCVASHQWCDGMHHCVDGSDEECPQFVPVHGTDSHYAPPPAVVHMDGRGAYQVKPLVANATCPATHFWCSDGYCIPVYMRCNGVADCVDHGDETECDLYACPGFYRCRVSTVCVHADSVCDGVFHCPQQDDELLCDLKCPEGCRCQGLAFVCTTFFPARSHPDLRYLDASGSGMTPDDLTHNVYMVSLVLSACRLDRLGNLTFPNLRILDVSDNKLTYVNTLSFHGCPNLRVVRLANNPVAFVPERAPGITLKHVHTFDMSSTNIETYDSNNMANFPRLKNLDLSYSRLKVITSQGFNSTPDLEVLDMRGSPLDEFPGDVLLRLDKLNTVYTSNYKLCCLVMLPDNFNAKNCHATENEVASCDDLLRSDVYRVCMWIMCVLTVVGNTGSVFTRLSVQRGSSKTSFSVFVTNLNVADLLMGVYLAIIGTADQVFRGVYLRQDRLWTRSVVCKTAGFLSLVSSEMSAFLICLITLDRFLALRFVFSRLRFSMRSALVSCALLWSVSFTLAIVPLLTPRMEFFGQNSICIPLPITKTASSGHRYSFGIMVILNMALFLLTSVGQMLIYDSVKKNSFMSDKHTAKDATIARRLITIALSDFMCWFPIALLGLLASKGTPVSSEVNVFMAIFVLPLNSALNPFLYTLNIVLEKRRKATEARLLEQLAKQLTSKRPLRHVGTMTSGSTFVAR